MKTNNEAEAVKHTPGPWDVETKGSKHFIDGPDGLTVAYVDRAGVRERREIEVNARLIAASPELAAMLATALDRIESANARFEAVCKIGYRTDDISAVLAKALSA